MGRKLIAASVLVQVLASSVVAQAEPLRGFSAGLAVWNKVAEANPLAGSSDSRPDDALGTVGIDENDNYMLYLERKSRLPLLSGVRLQHTHLAVSTGGAPRDDQDFVDASARDPGEAPGGRDLTHTDATVFWSLLDGRAALDLGVTGRYTYGEVQDQSTIAPGRVGLGGLLPMLYLAARVDLPDTGVYARVQGNYGALHGDRLVDAQATVGYATPLSFDLEAGYRVFDLRRQHRDELASARLRVDGFFAGVRIRI